MKTRPSITEICILAGGRSSRMGRDKATLLLGRKTLLDRILEIAQQTGWPVSIIDQDQIPQCGPLSGILTAFQKTRARTILFLSCDMPFVTTDLIKKVLRTARGKSACFAGTIGIPGFPFALQRSTLKKIAARIAAREYSLQALAASLEARRITLPPNALELFNLNTPEDWKAAQKLWARSAASKAEENCILQVSHLRIARGPTQILDNISWIIEKGQHWAILGANGSGKTSLLSALTGYLTPSRGEIVVLGRKFGRADWRELRKEIGLVSSSIRQMMADPEPALDTVISGKYAMIDIWKRITRPDRDRGLQILDQIACAHLADRPWLYLSQGERQRILIGRALMADPKVLILDEPCAGLDPAAREGFLTFLDGLMRWRDAPSVIFVTHHIEEITPRISHTLILRAGKTLASGEKDKVLRRSILTQAFGCPLTVVKRYGLFSMRVQRQRNSTWTRP